MANDDWRITIEVDGGARGRLPRAAGRRPRLPGARARGGARGAAARGLPRRRHDLRLRRDARCRPSKAHEVVEAELRGAGIEASAVQVEHWLADEERWDDEPTGRDLGRGRARAGLRAVGGARRVRLARGRRRARGHARAEGYKVVRRWHYLIVGAASREEPSALARDSTARSSRAASSSTRSCRANPFAIFGGIGACNRPVDGPPLDGLCFRGAAGRGSAPSAHLLTELQH